MALAVTLNTPGVVGRPIRRSDVLSNDSPDGSPEMVTVGSETESNSTTESTKFVSDRTALPSSSKSYPRSSKANSRSKDRRSSPGCTNLA